MGRGGQTAGDHAPNGPADGLGSCQGQASTSGREMSAGRMLPGVRREALAVIERCHLSDLHGKSEPPSSGESVVPTGQ